MKSKGTIELIFAIEDDGESGCWVGILGGGLHHVTATGVRSLGVEDGLPSSSIWGLHRGRDGLWIGTDRGLAELMMVFFESVLRVLYESLLEPRPVVVVKLSRAGAEVARSVGAMGFSRAGTSAV